MSSFESPQILLVEDNASDAELAVRALAKARLSEGVFHVKDGQEALDFLYGKGSYTARNPAVLPAVVLLDIKMPKLNGNDALRRIKADKDLCAIPVIILSSSGEKSDIERCYREGANSYIVKPLAYELFAETMVAIARYWLCFNQPPTCSFL
ncbi:response regulator [Foetidibacter luteolus]|uniref:response regulator n=1 Tax=Foetidibacter luteolus TaxID=2608880 RepID=UPI00129A6048|nr:response regulator [Foetidibacter luteolus]